MRKLAQPRFNDLPSLVRFALAAAISPSLFGAILSYLLVCATGGDGWASGVQWFFSNVLAVCIVFPFGMTVSLRQFGKLDLERRLFEALAIFSILTAVTLLSFRFSSYPLQFLVLAAALLATARFWLMGAGAAMIIITTLALASPQSFAGNGPLAA